jgi:type IV secretory pathway VirB4 component
MADQAAKAKDTVRQKKTSPSMSTQLFLDIAEIKDNVVVLKNGGLRAILQTTSINFNLKSEEEQNSIIYGYQSFLNSLEFPVQIVVQSRKLDVDKYIETVREIGDQHTNVLLKEQTHEYCDYILKLVEYADIMEKKFYVVVPYDPYRSRKQSTFSKFMSGISSSDSVDAIKRRHREFEDLNKNLTERISAVMAGLEGCNLRVAQLNTSQLIELFYQIYNPLTSRNEKIEDLGKMDVQEL